MRTMVKSALNLEFDVSGIENWTYRYFMECLITAIGENCISEIEACTARGFYKDLDEVVLGDGKPLNVQDPALSLLVQYLDATTSRSIDSIADIIDGLTSNFRLGTQPRVSGKFGMIHALFDLRNEGGWCELDRLVTDLALQSFSSIVDALSPSIRYSQDDPGLGGEKCYVLGFSEKNGKKTKVAFGSAPEHVLGFILEATTLAGNAFLSDKRERNTIWLHNGREAVFTIPLEPRLPVTVFSPDGEKNYSDFSELSVKWRAVQWARRDVEVMQALASVVPKEAGHAVKGKYLEDDLGL